MPPNGAGESRSVYVVQRHFRRVRRGYDPDEVDRHLQVVSEWFRDSRAGDEVRELEKQIQARERAVAEREQEAKRLVETNRLEAEATLDGARLRMNADKEEAGRILAQANQGAEEIRRRPDARRLRSSIRRDSTPPPPTRSARPVNGRRSSSRTPPRRPRASGPKRSATANWSWPAPGRRPSSCWRRRAPRPRRRLASCGLRPRRTSSPTWSAAGARSTGWSRRRAGSGARPPATPTRPPVDLSNGRPVG